MKKMLSLIMVLIVLTSLIGCGGKSSSTGGSSVDGISPALNKADTKTAGASGAGSGSIDFSADYSATESSDTVSGFDRAESLSPGSELGGSDIQPGAGILTAGQWDDNTNWPFFINLVNTNAITFPAYGLNPTNRVKVVVMNNESEPLYNKVVYLQNESGSTIYWQAKTDKTGTAYLFTYGNPEIDYFVRVEGYDTLRQVEYKKYAQNVNNFISYEMEVIIQEENNTYAGTQVMFILDTTGSMGDEITFLQKDFTAIAHDIQSNNIEYSVNFYKDTEDEYVTRTNSFTQDIIEVQTLINYEYASGGGDTPEAVSQILKETLVDNQEWKDDYSKLAFLIFDAPPHEGFEQELQSTIQLAAAKGIKVIPVVASNSDRETELFGRALAIMTNGTYVFLTDDSGVGNSHLEPIVGDYEVEKLHDVIVRIINENLA